MAPAKTKKNASKIAKVVNRSKSVKNAENTRRNSEEHEELSDFDELLLCGTEKLLESGSEIRTNKTSKKHKQRNPHDENESTDREVLPTENVLQSSAQSVENTANVKKTKKRRKKPVQDFSRFIHRVMLQIHGDEISISRNSMSIMNTFVIDMFERIAGECTNLLKINKKKVLTANVIQTAVRLVLPGEIASIAISEGVKALSKYERSKAGD